MWNLLKSIEWINSCIKHLIGNVNSASKIKILSNLKPWETNAQKTDRLYELRKDGRTCTYENPPKHNILVIKKRVLTNDILATTSNKICWDTCPKGAFWGFTDFKRGKYSFSSAIPSMQCCAAVQATYYPASRGASIFLDKSGRGRDSSQLI